MIVISFGNTHTNGFPFLSVMVSTRLLVCPRVILFPNDGVIVRYEKIEWTKKI